MFLKVNFYRFPVNIYDSFVEINIRYVKTWDKEGEQTKWLQTNIILFVNYEVFKIISADVDCVPKTQAGFEPCRSCITVSTENSFEKKANITAAFLDFTVVYDIL